MNIIMETFIGESGDYEEMSLHEVLNLMTDDWIDDKITSANISELRDVCKTLLEINNPKEKRMSNQDQKPLHEGREKKGGVNTYPKSPRPDIQPSGQGIPYK